tara:strand:- start:356 stop:502 length:147 start_codon:yes stop_codon:yes gene_type:complete
MFRVCDKDTGKVLFETTNIQELSDYMVAHETKYITAQPNQEEIDKCRK